MGKKRRIPADILDTSDNYSVDDVPLAVLLKKIEENKRDLNIEDSSDDDLPLVIFPKKPKDNEAQREKTKDDGSDGKPLTKRRSAIKTTSSNGSCRNKKTAVQDDDVPLIVDKQRQPRKKKTETTKTTPVSQSSVTRKRQGSSCNIPDDKPPIKGAKNPHVTKTLKIILKRSDAEAGLRSIQIEPTEEIPKRSRGKTRASRKKK